MLITDHIKLFMESPLRGENLPEFGVRFPDASKLYTPALRDVARKAAQSLSIPLREGVYMYFPGPQYETPAEVRAARILGADAPRLPGLVAVLMPGLSSEQAIADLDLMGVQVSGGAACAARSRDVSHVYRAMGLSDADARCVLRISVGRGATADDLTTAAEAVAEVYRRRAI